MKRKTRSRQSIPMGIVKLQYAARRRESGIDPDLAYGVIFVSVTVLATLVLSPIGLRSDRGADMRRSLMVLRESYDLFDDKIVQSDLLGLFPKEMVQNVNCHDERNAILVAHVLPDKVAVPGCRFVGIDFCLLDIEHTQMRQVIAHCVFSRFISNAAGNNDKVLVPVNALSNRLKVRRMSRTCSVDMKGSTRRTASCCCSWSGTGMMLRKLYLCGAAGSTAVRSAIKASASEFRKSSLSKCRR